MKRLMLFLILAIPLSANADGWPDLKGRNRDGAEVMISPTNLTDDDYVWKDGVGTPRPGMLSKYDIYVIVGETHQVFSRQQCDFVERKGARGFFSCARNAKSPIAGATYKIVPNPRDNCDYQAKFVCVKGCGSSSTPRVLTQSWWECGDL